MVLPETLFPEWNGPDQPIDKRSLRPRAWPASDQVDYARMGFTQVSMSRMSAEGLHWYRRVVTIGVDPARPFILVMDSLDKVQPYIWSMLFMSQGAVVTPAGPVIPVDRVHDGSGRHELPSGTPEKAMGAGLSRFAFTGQSWNKMYHPTGGIDWDLWMRSSVPGSFSMAQWTTTWENSAERDDFLKANGRPYSETQQILRIRNTRPLFAAIMPRGKDQPALEVKASGDDGFTARNGKDAYRFERQGFLLTSGDHIFAASWDAATFSRDGFVLGNGPVEIESGKDSVIVRVHGQTGKRKVELPWEVQMPAASQGLTVESKAGRTVITIDWRSAGTDLPSYMASYREFRFRRRS